MIGFEQWEYEDYYVLVDLERNVGIGHNSEKQGRCLLLFNNKHIAEAYRNEIDAIDCSAIRIDNAIVSMLAKDIGVRKVATVTEYNEKNGKWKFKYGLIIFESDSLMN